VDRTQKAEIVGDLNAVFKATGVVVVSQYTGLSVAEMTALRGRMREAGAVLRVAKNSLAKLALDGAPFGGIVGLLKGPTVLAWSNDPVAAPRVLTKYAKENEKLVILGGALGASILDPAGIKALADLPSLDELRARLVGMIKTPATRVAGVLQAPAGQLARVLAAHAKAQGAEAAA
jgi:large subunit ribosomal protein L10